MFFICCSNMRRCSGGISASCFCMASIRFCMFVVDRDQSPFNTSAGSADEARAAGPRLARAVTITRRAATSA